MSRPASTEARQPEQAVASADAEPVTFRASLGRVQPDAGHSAIRTRIRTAYAAAVAVMATPDGRWIVAVIHAYGGRDVFRVRERAIIGAHGGAGWAPIGKIRLTVAEVAELLGDDFIELVYRP